MRHRTNAIMTSKVRFDPERDEFINTTYACHHQPTADELLFIFLNQVTCCAANDNDHGHKKRDR